MDAIKGQRLTELATAKRLVYHYGKDMRHALGFGWLVWSGERWEQSGKAAQRNAQKMGAVIRSELESQVPDIAKASYSHAKSMESAAGVQAILKHAEALLDGDKIEWDAHPWLLNVPNGTLDLRTGGLEPHHREHHLTKLCPTPYDPGVKCPRWLKFLGEVFDGDTELVEYWQWTMGYALSGATDYDCFFVLYGSGANGKTTLLRVEQDVIGGDYAQQIDPQELMVHRNARHTTERAQLRGARFVAAVESNDGAQLNESLIKGLTGGDKMRARLMRQDSFEFVPELKLFIGTNSHPAIKDSSTGMWRRVRLIPFEATFAGNDCDPQLHEKLLTEREGILA